MSRPATDAAATTAAIAPTATANSRPSTDPARRHTASGTVGNRSRRAGSSRRHQPGTVASSSASCSAQAASSPSVTAAPTFSSPGELLTRPVCYTPTMPFHRFANSARSPAAMSRAIASRSRIAASGKISGSSASAAVSSSSEEASTSRAAGTGQT